MVQCVVFGCVNRQSESEKSKCQKAKELKSGKIGFFKFPNDPNIRTQWENAIRRKNWKPSKSSRVCSEHFPVSCFKYLIPKHILEENAVPSIFSEHPEHLQPKVKKRNTSNSQRALLSKTHPSFDPAIMLNGELKVRISKSKITFPVLPEKSSQPNTSILRPKSPEPDPPICQEALSSINLEDLPIEIATSSLSQPYSLNLKNIANEKTICISPFLKCENITTDRAANQVFPNENLESTSVMQPCKADTPVKKRLKYLLKKEQEKFSRLRKISSEKCVKFKRKLNTLYIQNKRLKKNVFKLKTIIKSLKEARLLNGDDLETLYNLKGMNEEFLQRQIAKGSNNSVKKQYGKELRVFALNLHYFSPKAYDFVRTTFSSALPHPKTLTKWYMNIDGRPGFTIQSFETLKKLSAETGKKVVCSLVLDEMVIRRAPVETDGKTYFGYEDLGLGLEGDDRPLASQVLVFMLVCMNDRWKIPIAYFFIASMTGDKKATLVKQALSMACESGVSVKSITCDGASNNFSMANSLGADLDTSTDSFKSWFMHPVSKERIFFNPDACHMIKLVRNTLHKFKILIDSEGNEVKWQYFEELCDLQEQEGLHLANKLKKKHICFQLQKMKVYLATQLLSNSVGDALQTCIDLNYSKFLGCEPLIKFIKIFNNIFDIFNSKSLFQKDFKKPLCAENYSKYKIFLKDAVFYIRNLKLENGTPVLNSGNRVGFKGFIILAKNLLNLYEDLCIKQENPFSHISCYKFSQDHIELFFGKIRMRGGFNNNPTCRQFCGAYKRNLVNLQLQPSSNGNCLPLEDIPILSVSSSPNLLINLTSGTRMKHDDFQTSECTFEIEKVEEYVINYNSLSLFKRTVNTYMAGYVVRSLSQSIKCAECVFALREYPVERNCELIKLKNKGGLITPSRDTVKIINVSELIFEGSLGKQDGKFYPSVTILKLVAMVMQYFFENNLYHNLFPSMNDHYADIDVLFNHKYLLVKSVALKYLEARVHHYCKNIVDLTSSKRNIFNKLVLFQGQ